MVPNRPTLHRLNQVIHLPVWGKALKATPMRSWRLRFLWYRCGAYLYYLMKGLQALPPVQTDDPLWRGVTMCSPLQLALMMTASDKPELSSRASLPISFNSTSHEQDALQIFLV